MKFAVSTLAVLPFAFDVTLLGRFSSPSPKRAAVLESMRNDHFPPLHC